MSPAAAAAGGHATTPQTWCWVCSSMLALVLLPVYFQPQQLVAVVATFLHASSCGGCGAARDLLRPAGEKGGCRETVRRVSFRKQLATHACLLACWGRVQARQTTRTRRLAARESLMAACRGCLTHCRGLRTLPMAEQRARGKPGRPLGGPEAGKLCGCKTPWPCCPGKLLLLPRTASRAHIHVRAKHEVLCRGGGAALDLPHGQNWLETL